MSTQAPPQTRIERRLARYAEAVRMVDEGTARPKVAEAVGLLREGLTGTQAAARMGLSKSQVYQLLNDPTDEKNRARKARHNGTCASCGAETSYGNGSGPARFCDRCFRTRHAARDAEIIERWNRGETGEHIGAAMGLRPQVVRGVIQPNASKGKPRRGVFHRRPDRELWPEIERLWAEGKTAGEIARRLGLKRPQNVYAMVKNMRDAGISLERRA
jgi:hypothetical protein